MTTPNLEWTCFHCGQRCGGRLETGYRALTGEFTPDGAIHACCDPYFVPGLPSCYLRITQFGERPGALRGVDPLPVGVEDIRA